MHLTWRFSLVFTVSILIISLAPAHAQIQTDAQLRLQTLSDELRVDWQKERMQAEIRAVVENIPIRSVLPDGSIIELQRFERGIPVYYQTENIIAAQTTSTDKVWEGGSSGLNLSGAGISLGIWDGGAVRTTHQEFQGRAAVFDGTKSLHWHSTHVGGTMIGAGINPDAKGMAYKALLQSNNWNSDDAEMTVQAANGLQVSNHSYGTITGWRSNYFGDGRYAWFGDPGDDEDYKFGFYSGDARSWDMIAYNAPNYLIVKSAGNDRNDGPSKQPVTHYERVNGQWKLVSDVREKDGGSDGFDCIPTSGNAKNILTVGAVNDIKGGYTTPTDVKITSFSGWGPTDDGRIKPDIVANGSSLYSCTSTSDNAYTSSSGTSMSAPNASGSIGLLLGLQKRLTGSPVIKSSTMKALIIHTADEAGSYPGPDYKYGWGLMNTARAATLMQRNADQEGVNVIAERTLQQGDQIDIVVRSPGRGPLKATICWTDPAGTVPSTMQDPPDIMLVNDLDLRILAPDATPFTPWVLDPSRPNAAASRGDNIVDNVEQILIEKPVEGDYTIRINHKGSLKNGEQLVSVIISVADQPSLFSPPGGMMNVSLTPSLQWNFMNGADSYHVQVAETPDFKNPIVDKTDVFDTYFIPQSLQRDTRYFWRVRLLSTQGNSDWSEVRSFITGGIPTSAGHALYFDGLDDYVELPHNAGFNSIESTDVVTVEAWVYIESWYNNFFSVVDKYNPDTDFGWVFQVHKNSGLNFNGSTSVDFPWSPALNTWYHVAVSYDKAEGIIRSFVDGTLLYQTSYDGDIQASNGGPLYIGFNPSGGDEYSNGVIDELRIWKTARTEQQISDNMTVRIDEQDPDLVALYRLDDAQGFNTINAADNTTGSVENGPVWLVSQAPLDLPGKPVLIEPAQSALSVRLIPEFVWQSSTSADRYRMQVSRDAAFLDVVYQQQNLELTTNSGATLDPETSYYWRVRASNKRGSSAWSETGEFRTAQAPPGPPKLISPADDAIDQQPNVDLLWSAADRATSYRIQASTDSLFEVGVSSFIVDAEGHSTTLIRAENLGDNTLYYWRVAGENAGGVGPWSLVWKFTTLPLPPEAPELTLPADGSRGLSGNIQFKWTAPDFAQYYRLQIATDDQFTNITVDQPGIPLASYLTSGLQSATEFYWRVQASNSAGISGWSETWTFITERPIPDPPVLASPTDADTDVTIPAVLTWNPSQYADAYDVEVSRDAGFAQIMSTGSDITGTSFTTTLLPESFPLFWRARAKNESGTSDWSTVWTFTTGVVQIAQPMLIAPDNGATGVDNQPEFSWHEVSGSEAYEIQVSTTNGFGAPEYTDLNVTTTTYSGFTIVDPGTYYWRVRAVTSVKEGPWSEIWSFSTSLPLPDKVSLRSPAFASEVNALDVAFTWDPGSPGVDKYMLQYTEQGADSTDLDNPSLAKEVTTGATATTTVTINEPSDKVWWRVRAGNATGWGQWSDSWYFTPKFTGINDLPSSSNGFAISAMYPNPTRNGATVSVNYTVPQTSFASLALYNAAGKILRTLTLSRHLAGFYTARFNADRLPPGTYYVVLQAGEVMITRPITVIR